MQQSYLLADWLPRQSDLRESAMATKHCLLAVYLSRRRRAVSKTAIPVSSDQKVRQPPRNLLNLAHENVLLSDAERNAVRRTMRRMAPPLGSLRPSFWVAGVESWHTLSSYVS
jgi:hypothetical protein